MAHACLAQTFFCLAGVTLAGRDVAARWRRGPRPSAAQPVAPDGAATRGRRSSCSSSIGAVMRHTKAGLAIPDFPLALGRLVPPISSFPVGDPLRPPARGARRRGVVARLRDPWRSALRRRASKQTRRSARRCSSPLRSRSARSTVLSRKAVAVTTAHVATGALLLGTALCCASRSALARGRTTALRTRAARSSPDGGDRVRSRRHRPGRRLRRASRGDLLELTKPRITTLVRRDRRRSGYAVGAPRLRSAAFVALLIAAPRSSRAAPRRLNQYAGRDADARMQRTARPIPAGTRGARRERSRSAWRVCGRRARRCSPRSTALTRAARPRGRSRATSSPTRR